MGRKRVRAGKAAPKTDGCVEILCTLCRVKLGGYIARKGTYTHQRRTTCITTKDPVFAHACKACPCVWEYFAGCVHVCFKHGMHGCLKQCVCVLSRIRNDEQNKLTHKEWRHRKPVLVLCYTVCVCLCLSLCVNRGLCLIPRPPWSNDDESMSGETTWPTDSNHYKTKPQYEQLASVRF